MEAAVTEYAVEILSKICISTLTIHENDEMGHGMLI